MVVATDESSAWVTPQAGNEAQGACGQCADRGGCGLSLLGRALRRRDPCVRVANPIGARVGDSVRVAIPSTTVLKASALLYGIPVLGVLFGSGFADLVTPGDLAALLGAAGGGGLGFWGARRLTPHLGFSRFGGLAIRDRIPDTVPSSDLPS